MSVKISVDFLKNRFKEISGICFIIFAVFLFVALVTYHPLDPSFNLSVDNFVNNKSGKWGAYIASPLLQVFGLSCFLIVICSFVWGIIFYRKKIIDFFFFRVIGLLVALVSMDGFLAIFDTVSSWDFIGYGGFIGHYIFYRFGVEYSLGLYLFSLLTIFAIAFSFAISLRFKIYKIFLQKSLKILLVYSKVFLLQKLPKIYVKSKEHIRLFIRKKFFRQRIKDIDTGYSKSKGKISKIAKEFKSTSDLNYKSPNIDLLASNSTQKIVHDKNNLIENAKRLSQTLEDFGVKGEILDVKPGPVVTLYELEPSPGIKSSRIIGLADDVARSMSAGAARISVIAGKNALGIELPNEKRETVFLKEMLETKEYLDPSINLPLALGKNIGGDPVVADLSKMPHLMVAGTTGSGKSVAINTMILSLVFRLSPNECKFIMVDPKMLELSVYDGIPHLLTPVVTDPKKAISSLRWAVQEMENRYRLMSSLGVRNVNGYNAQINEAIKEGKTLTRTVQTGFDQETGQPIHEEVELDMTTLPYIVIIIDEMADLMLVAGKEIESYLQRLAQMARAAGIHLVIATQRPSVDVITGVIKANFPTRISFQVTSKIDSRTILGEQGAEQLLGMGDMLYMFGGSRLTRVHGPFVSDKEVGETVSLLKSQGNPSYIDEIINQIDEDGEGGFSGDNGEEKDELYDQAVNIVLNDKKVSTSYVQRQLKIGYNRAANIIERMEKEGLISAPSATGRREILVNNN